MRLGLQPRELLVFLGTLPSPCSSRVTRCHAAEPLLPSQSKLSDSIATTISANLPTRRNVRTRTMLEALRERLLFVAALL